LGRVVSKVNALLNVAFQALNSLAQKPLLFLGKILQGVGGLLGAVGLEGMLVNIQHHGKVERVVGGSLAYSKFNRDGEEVTASLLCNFLATRNTGKIDIAGLDKSLLAFNSAKELLSETSSIESATV
jgi:hypothetical protein